MREMGNAAYALTPLNKAQALPRDTPESSTEIVFLSKADIKTTLQERLPAKSLFISFQAVRLPAEAGLFCSLCSIWGWTCSHKPILQLSGLRSQKAKGLKWKILHRWTH